MLNMPKPDPFQTFILELLVSSEERAFIDSLMDDPNDHLTRSAYADWLEERGRATAASMIRATVFIPGVRNDSYPFQSGSHPLPMTMSGYGLMPRSPASDWMPPFLTTIDDARVVVSSGRLFSGYPIGSGYIGGHPIQTSGG